MDLGTKNGHLLKTSNGHLSLKCHNPPESTDLGKIIQVSFAGLPPSLCPTCNELAYNNGHYVDDGHVLWTDSPPLVFSLPWQQYNSLWYAPAHPGAPQCMVEAAADNYPHGAVYASAGYQCGVRINSSGPYPVITISLSWCWEQLSGGMWSCGGSLGAGDINHSGVIFSSSASYPELACKSMDDFGTMVFINQQYGSGGSGSATVTF